MIASSGSYFFCSFFAYVELKIVKKVYIQPGCISCGACESICPEVFEVNTTSAVRADVDLEKHKECIREVATICPVGVIQYEE